MTSFFYWIEDLFVNHLFWPYDTLRAMNSWWSANFLNGLLFLIGIIAFLYWMLQLKKYDDNNEEDKDITAHPYL